MTAVDPPRLFPAGNPLSAVAGAPAKLVLAPDGRTASLVVEPTLAKGQYNVLFSGTLVNGQPFVDASVQIDVQP